MVDTKRVLTVGFGAELEHLLGEALARSPFDVNRVPGGRSAMEVVAFVPFDLVLILFPVEDVEAAQVVAAIRREGSKSARAAVFLVCAPHEVDRADLLVGVGADRVLSTALGEIALQEEVLRTLRARPRLAMRVMTRLTVRLGDVKTQFLSQTRDLSRTGSLVLTDRMYPIGTLLHFVLEITDGPVGIRGEAEVVRHANPRREGAEGLGLRFVSFEGSGEAQLVAYLEKLGA